MIPQAFPRTATSLVLAVVLVVGLLSGGTSDLPEFGSEPRVLHPVVVDETAYLDDGYARGAHVLTLTGILVGISADKTIAATRSTGGRITGYRLQDGTVAWDLSGEQEQRHCSDSEVHTTQFHSGLAWCQDPQDRPRAALDLATGRWIDFGFWGRYPDVDYLGSVDHSLFLSVLDSQRGELSLVRLDFDGRLVYSVPVFGGVTEATETRCSLAPAMVVCKRDDSDLAVFDYSTGEAKGRFSGLWLWVTSDGYQVRRDYGSEFRIYDRAGEHLATKDGPWCDFVPRRGALYSNADELAQDAWCDFKLVGPSGRVYAQQDHDTSYCLLTQTGTKVPVSGFVFPEISHDEQVLALVPPREAFSDDGVRLLDPATGELIASFPLPWGRTELGIIYWTDLFGDPDNKLGTQVLVPGPKR